MTMRAPALAICAVLVASCDGTPSEPNAKVPAATQTTAAAASADGPSTPTTTDPLEPQARAAAGELASTLMGRLKTELAAGGPVAAITVCHEEAPAIAAQVSERTGFAVSRVSLKHRNPEMGVPEPWEADVLASFERAKASGRDPATLTYSARAEGEYRFMKAIPTAPLCLNCHGKTLDPAVAARLDDLYPDDRATGYEAGDIRGAFVVTRKL